MNNMKENMENIKLKLMDFNVFDALKDKNVKADIDAVEILIKSKKNLNFNRIKRKQMNKI